MLEVEVLLLHYDNVKLQSEEERRSGRRYFRDVAVLVCFFSSFPLRLPSCSFWKQAFLIPNRFTLNNINLSCYFYLYSSHLNYLSPLDINLHHFLYSLFFFLFHFLFLLILCIIIFFILFFCYPFLHFSPVLFRYFLHSLLQFPQCFLLHFLHFLLLRSLPPLLVLLPVPVQVLVLLIVVAVLAVV